MDCDTIIDVPEVLSCPTVIVSVTVNLSNWASVTEMSPVKEPVKLPVEVRGSMQFDRLGHRYAAVNVESLNRLGAKFDEREPVIYFTSGAYRVIEEE